MYMVVFTEMNCVHYWPILSRFSVFYLMSDQRGELASRACRQDAGGDARQSSGFVISEIIRQQWKRRLSTIVLDHRNCLLWLTHWLSYTLALCR